MNQHDNRSPIMSAVAARKIVRLTLTLQKLLDKKPLQYAIIFALVSNTPGISFKEIAAASSLSKSTASRIVDWYVSKGIMEAHEIPKDRRNKAAYLTAEGEKIAHSLAFQVEY